MMRFELQRDAMLCISNQRVFYKQSNVNERSALKNILLTSHKNVIIIMPENCSFFNEFYCKINQNFSLHRLKIE